MTLFLAGGQEVTSWWIEDPAVLCGKTQIVFGAEVYRKSTGDLVVGKYLGKR